LATLSIADGGEGRGEEVLSFIESARSTILGFKERIPREVRVLNPRTVAADVRRL
jgi:hypothetical protein